MAFAKVYSAAIIGLDAYTVEVEVNIDYQGFPGFRIVGLASKEIEEAKERVRSAIKNSGYKFPNRRITVNLAPADLPKKGSLYDFPIAIGILIAAGAINNDVSKYLLFGELSLNGKINKVAGGISLVSHSVGFAKGCILSLGNAKESCIISKAKMYAVEKLSEAVGYLNGDKIIHTYPLRNFNEVKSKCVERENEQIDFADIKGQENVKRALELAVAGGHNVSIVGPPGTGKTMLAKAMVSILPDLSEDEALEVTKIYSVVGSIEEGEPFVLRRPFRAPHHSITRSGILGGGNPIAPGEITLAHNGILFLDEFPELSRKIIESLRQPIESAEISIRRNNKSIRFPCRFTLIIASNPCPCGQMGNPQKTCSCSLSKIKEYQDKLSGPISDRIDINVNSIQSAVFAQGESSKEILKRIKRAREIQFLRYVSEAPALINASLNPIQIKKYCPMSHDAEKMANYAFSKMKLSLRGYHKVIKVSRTIADLSNFEVIQENHVAEALQYRL